MRQSLQEYTTALGHWGWVILMDILSGITGAYLDISDSWGFPTWLWLILLCIGLVIVPFIAFHKVRIKRDEFQKQLDDKAKIKDIREKLGHLLNEGQDIKAKCYDRKSEPPKMEAEGWAARVTEFLIPNLGSDYVNTFFSSDGLSLGVTTLSGAHSNVERYMRNKLARLNQFLDILRQNN